MSAEYMLFLEKKKCQFKNVEIRLFPGSFIEIKLRDEAEAENEALNPFLFVLTAFNKPEDNTMLSNLKN